MSKGQRPVNKIDDVEYDGGEEEFALQCLCPGKIRKECLSVGPDSGKVDDRERDIQYVEYDGKPQSSSC